ncbi:MAG: hypothetical protein ACRD59_02960 [Candidatus Acidiferrales bacterium]
MKTLLALIALLAISTAAFVEISIPAGTVIPVALHGSLSTRKSQPGQAVKARIMQDIPYRWGEKIKAGTYVAGRVISVTPAGSGTAGRISFQFDQLLISKSSMPIQTSLRALASILEINGAQIPKYGDRGSGSNANNTTQVGGEVVYRGGGRVMQGELVVGEPLLGDGVLGRVRENAERNCGGAAGGNNRLQALWLFSSNACGVYGYSEVRIVHTGRAAPLGQIELVSDRGDILIRGGSGMLLRVDAAEGEAGTDSSGSPGR